MIVGAVAIAASLAGCYSPGGSGFSTDTHTYVSTSWQPTTVALRDTRTGQDIWSVDIPVGKQLVVHFRKNEAMKNTPTPEIMEWEIMDAGEMFGELDNSIPVPGGTDKRLDPKLRPAPELPPGMTGSGAPTNQGT
jgi:hypothetical protein